MNATPAAPYASNLPRPIVLSAVHLRAETRRVLLHAAAAVLIVLAAIAVGGYAAVDIVRQSYLVHNGVPAKWASVTGQIESRDGLLHGNELHVRYGDQAGVEHNVDMNFTSVFEAVPKYLSERVWYDPQDPESIGVNLAVEIAPYRWIAIALGVLIALGVSLMIWKVDVAPMAAHVRLIKAVGAGSQEIIVRRTRVDMPHDRDGRPVDGVTRWHFAGRAPDGREVTGEAVMPKRHRPRFADAECTVMIALWSPAMPGTALVLRDDLAPFQMVGAQPISPGMIPARA